MESVGRLRAVVVRDVEQDEQSGSIEPTVVLSATDTAARCILLHERAHVRRPLIEDPRQS